MGVDSTPEALYSMTQRVSALEAPTVNFSDGF